MRCPSEKALVAAFKLTPAKARLIRNLCNARDSRSLLEGMINKYCPETAKYANSCHNYPYSYEMWRTTLVLDAVNHIIGGYGVEALGPGSGSGHAPPYEYVNMGDTYATTIIYKHATDALSIGNWGDIVEREDKHGTW